MPNQNQLVRRAAAALLACGLIVGPLPGFAALRLYRNGREVDNAPCSGLSTFAPNAFGIGVKLDRTGTLPERNTRGFWHGLIDELAVFRDALTPDRIEKLFQHTRDISSNP